MINIDEKKFNGRVSSVKGRDIHIFYQEKTIICRIKNALFRTTTNQKNTISVGDKVIFNDNNQIIEILSRNTILERMDPLNHRKRQILASNIDQVYITFSIESPAINITMVDKYVIAAKKGNLAPIILINKIDLCKSRSFIDKILSIYKKIDIPIIAVSVKTKEGIANLTSSLQDKTSIFSGPSGVGKTSLINLISDKNLLVGKISKKIKKGTHTTTHSSLIPLNNTSFIIDSPGVASFSLYNPSKEEILDYFSDLNIPLGECRFRGCTHTHEPSCAVKEAAKKGLIDPKRFLSYKSTIDEMINSKSSY